MITNFTDTKHGKYSAAKCMCIFIIIFLTSLLLSITLERNYHLLFHAGLFFTGWLAWTFLEYMSHRYFMHPHKDQKLWIDFNHTYHHTHPGEIKITSVQRFVLLSLCILLVTISIALNNYFTLAAGFFCGFPGYTFMHFLLHQKVMQPWFKKMITYHVYHHCKYPDRCFGISVTWWDDLLRTSPPQQGMISQRIIDFYFNEHTHE
jgi:hypothetical protein